MILDKFKNKDPWKCELIYSYVLRVCNNGTTAISCYIPKIWND